MAAGHRSQSHPSNNRTIDKNLEESQSSGSLDLSSRKLSEFPKNAESYDLADTVEADLSKNRFSEIPKEVCQFVLLERLNCYHNAIRALPENIIKLQYLGFLDLSRNQLSNLPSFLSELKCLEVLIVSHNRLVSIPEEIGQLQLLMEMDISNNEIAAVPPQIGDLGELKILNIRKNLLQELPQEMSRLRLKSFDFSCNKIQTIPIEFRFMDTLEELVLDNNPLLSPPADICTKGRVHILKYLHILAIKEDKRRGVLSESGFNRNTLRRSYQKDDAETVRLRRKAIISTDSGYTTDSPFRWTTGGVENGFDGPVKAAESLKEQRAERHLELQKRICNAELISPSRVSGGLTPTTSDSVDGGSISPLKFTVGGPETGEDMFARNDLQEQELQRQKQEYEQRKKRAEQLKVEGGAKRSIKAAQTSAGPFIGSVPTGRPPQPPVRSASVNVEKRSMLYEEREVKRPNQLSVSRQHSFTLPNHFYLERESGIVHGYNGGVLSSPSPMRSGHYYPYMKHRDKDDQRRGEQDSKRNGATHPHPQAMDRSTDSHRSSPISVSSQDGEQRSSGPPSIASSGGQEVNVINKLPPHPSSDEPRRPSSENSHKILRPRSRSSFREKLALPSTAALTGNSATDYPPTPGTSVGARQSSAAKSLPSAGFQSVGALARGAKSKSSSPTVNGAGPADSETHGGGSQSSSKPVGDAQHIADIKQIIESRLKVTLPKDVMAELRDGVILCHLANHVKPRTVSQIHVKSSAVPKLTMAKCKRNVDNFIDACRRLGVTPEQLCSQADIIDDKRPAPILCTVHALIDLKTSSKGSHPNQGTNSSGSRPNPPRSRSNVTGPQSRSLANTSRTSSSGSSKPRSHPPLHSFV